MLLIAGGDDDFGSFYDQDGLLPFRIGVCYRYQMDRYETSLTILQTGT